MNTSAPTTASFNVPVNSSRLVFSAIHSSSPSEPSAAPVHHPVDVGDHHVLGPRPRAAA